MSHAALTQVQGLLNAGRLTEARSLLQQVMRRGSSPMLDHAMAVTLARLAEPAGLEQAAFFAQRALDSAGVQGPGAAEFASTLGNILTMQGRHDKGVAAFRAALAAKPDLPGARLGLANALRSLHRYSEAADLMRDATDPLARATLAATHLSMGDPVRAWDIASDAATRHPDDLTLATTRANIACYVPGLSRDDEWRAQRTYGEIFDRNVRITPPPLERSRDTDRPLTLGLVSPDFREHSVGCFLTPLLANLDPARFRTVLYFSGRTDPATDRFRRLASTFRDVTTLSDQDLAMTLRRDAVDILIDLSGHTLGHRLPLFVFRAAPVQATYLGYPSITGLSTIDARLVDAITDPPDEANTLSSERLLHLDAPFLAFELPAATPAPRPAKKPGDPITFGSFNAMPKLNPLVLDTWAALLARVPNSRLILKSAPLADDAVRSTVLARFTAARVDPSRVECLPTTPTRDAHLHTYARLDLALDPFPYHGTTTTCEAAAMGVPTLTLRGDRHATRVGATLNAALGLQHLIADSPAQYLDYAAALAADPARLATLHATLRARLAASPLCDGPRLARAFDAALRGLWGEWCRANPT
jgi:predicted O-linked N-acetylglucosamine transferase (SPINDLY family)